MVTPNPAVAPDPGISNIGQISIRVHDLARATAFYSDTLGLPFLFATKDLGFFNCGGVRLMLSRPEKPEFDHPGSVLYFRVSNITEAFHKLRDKGTHMVDEPHLIARMPDHELWMCFFHDTEKNLLALMSEVRSGK
jgi:predicted enzyme related to lactoylglutathione lyase